MLEPKLRQTRAAQSLQADGASLWRCSNGSGKARTNKMEIQQERRHEAETL